MHNVEITWETVQLHQSVEWLWTDWMTIVCVISLVEFPTLFISTFCATTVVQNLEIMWEIDGCA